MSVTYPERARCEDIPEFFPTVQMDTRINCLRKVCDLQIHLVLSFDGLLDIARLRRAIRLTLDAEPVLGCRLLERAGKMVWQRRTDLDRLDLLTVVRDVEDVQLATTSYMAQPLNLDDDPLVQAALFRKDSYDTLCLKVSHIVADGGALGEYGELLAFIYRQLDVDFNFLPESNIDGERCIHQVTRRFGVFSKLMHVKQLITSYCGELFPRRNWSFPTTTSTDLSERTYVLHHLDNQLSTQIVSFAKANSLTVNDVCVAACYRALFAVIQPQHNIPLRLGTAVNLRRYLPEHKGAAICNLSAMFQLNIGDDIGTDLLMTAQKVNRAMAVYKRNDIGMGDKRYFLFDQNWLSIRLQMMMHRYHQLFKFAVGPKEIMPIFSNAGVLDAQLVDFGDCRTKSVFATPPISLSAAFFVGMSCFHGTLTLSSGFCERIVSKEHVALFFCHFEEELKAAIMPVSNGPQCLHRLTR